MTGQVDNLEEIRDLLFGREKKTLASLNERVSQPKLRGEDVSSVLPNAIKSSYESGPLLVRRMQAPVDECIKTSLRDSPDEYAEALYPIMGPAIRRSIAETFKAYTQQINQSMEQGLSIKYLRWRMQASRAGVPVAQYILQKTLQYRVEQGYLISRDSGMLIAHVHHDAAEVRDNDAVSAMFTAIQDFIQDSFSTDQSGRLDTAEMGEFSLWAVHGPQALLVCVIRGVPPKSLRADMAGLLERLHGTYKAELKDYNGHSDAADDIQRDLQPCLEWQARDEKARSKSFLRKPLFWLGLAVVCGLAWWAFNAWSSNNQQQQITDALANVPGIYLDRVSKEDGTFVIHGLRDPVAADVASLLSSSTLENGQWRNALRPYRSLEPEIIRTRALQSLQVPDTVNSTETETALVLDGVASESWLNRTRQLQASGLLDFPLDITSVQSSSAEELQRLLQRHAETALLFASGTTLVSEQPIQELTTAIGQLAALANEIGWVIEISITGWADASGTAAANLVLAEQRGRVVLDQLQRGITDTRIRWVERSPSVANIIEASDMRRAVVTIRRFEQ